MESSLHLPTWWACKEGNLVITQLSNGLETEIGNIESNFSVGEKQLLCLARALLSNTKYLVLDEATSNVDMATDQKIQKAIRENFKGVTIIAIAHRLQTIQDYDNVIVMENGRILEKGKPENFLRMGK